MKATRRGILVVLICFALFAALSCSPPGGGTGQKIIAITGVGWVLENIDIGYWNNGFNSGTCFGWFSISYSGDISVADIDYAQFHKVGDSWYWQFPIDSTTVDAANRRIYSYLNYSTQIAANGSVFPIGQLEFEVALKNGNAVSYVFDVPAPGQLTSSGKGYVYSEDYVGTPAPNYAAMLRRPTYISHNMAGTITLSFGCNDPKLFNGYAEFYDSINTVVGRSPYFRTYGTGVVASFVNGGYGIYNNGSPNSVVIQPSDISFVAGKAYSDVAKYSVKLTDGAQYLGTSHTYDCVSMGPKMAFF